MLRGFYSRFGHTDVLWTDRLFGHSRSGVSVVTVGRDVYTGTRISAGTGTGIGVPAAVPMPM